MKWGERVKLRPLRPGELEEIDAGRRLREAERAGSHAEKSVVTENEMFESLLGPTGEIGLSSVDFASEAQAGRFFAWAAKRRSNFAGRSDRVGLPHVAQGGERNRRSGDGREKSLGE